MKEDLENQLMSREAELLEQLQQQKDALIIEKKIVEENLQKSMEKALEEKNKELEDQLHKEKERLEKVDFYIQSILIIFKVKQLSLILILSVLMNICLKLTILEWVVFHYVMLWFKVKFWNINDEKNHCLQKLLFVWQYYHVKQSSQDSIDKIPHTGSLVPIKPTVFV